MAKTDFIIDGPDKRGRVHIIEGEKRHATSEFNVKRFVCEVQTQETEKETQALAEQIVRALEAFDDWQ